MENLKAGDLTIEAVEAVDGSAVHLKWAGKSAERYPGKVLGPYFTAVLSQAAQRRATIEQHFEKLEHFNSSTVTAIIQMIQEARGRNVKQVLLFDQKLKWQTLTFEALRVFVKGDDLLQIRAAQQTP